MFNFFKKKNNNSEKSNGIIITNTKDGKVGNFWDGFLGFQNRTLNDSSRELSACALEYGNKTNLENSLVISILKNNFTNILAYLKNEHPISAYPTIISDKSINFTTKKIIEWKHMDNCEAQIEGGGENKFALSFFADDYVINKHKYHNSENLNITITGFVLTMEQYEDSEGFSKDFVSYMPNSDYGKYSVIDFVGEVKTLKLVNENIYGIEVKGYLITLILIRSKEDNLLFEIDVFLNKENTELEKIKIGDKLTGMIKLMGRIK